MEERELSRLHEAGFPLGCDLDKYQKMTDSTLMREEGFNHEPQGKLLSLASIEWDFTIYHSFAFLTTDTVQ